MTLHTLKIEECFYDAKIAGDKLFEIRYNGDRGFQKGDGVRYTSTNGLVPFEGLFIITYVSSFEQKDGFVVFGEKRTN